jgi:cysteine desulfurase
MIACFSTATLVDCKVFVRSEGTMSAGQRSYLDHNATSPLRPEAVEAVVRALQVPGNPSSIHAEGRAARAVIETARDRIAAFVGASPKNVVFTSGGTEAANAVLSPSFHRIDGPPATLLLVGSTEHPCGLEGHRFAPERVERIPVTSSGAIDLGWLARRLEQAHGEQVLVSIQTANNETGVLQPVVEAARLVHGAGGLIHTDAVQAAGRIPLDIASLEVDALTLSAHKLGGPKGVGALVLASDRLQIADRLVRGGGQERGHRAGTENVAGIAGFAAAADAAAAHLDEERARLEDLRDTAQAELRRVGADAVVFAEAAERLPNTLAFAVPGVRAETALIRFDLEGVALSSGSACSSGKVRRSHVLEAMGVDAALAAGALRMSLGWNSTKEDVNRFVQACEMVVSTLYKRRADAA